MESTGENCRHGHTADSANTCNSRNPGHTCDTSNSRNSRDSRDSGHGLVEALVRGVDFAVTRYVKPIAAFLAAAEEMRQAKGGAVA